MGAGQPSRIRIAHSLHFICHSLSFGRSRANLSRAAHVTSSTDWFYSGGHARDTTTNMERAGPLLGVRVLEVGNFIAGPFAGQLFGDYGAEVIKIESPERRRPDAPLGRHRRQASLWWPTIARNKQSVVADLKDPDDLAMVQRLAPRCDVVLENFRPGRSPKFGLDYRPSRRRIRDHRHPRVGLRPDRTAGDRGRLRLDRRGHRRDPPHHRRRRPASSPCGISLGDSLRRCSPSSARWPRCTSEQPADGARRSTWRSTRQSPR